MLYTSPHLEISISNPSIYCAQLGHFLGSRGVGDLFGRFGSPFLSKVPFPLYFRLKTANYICTSLYPLLTFDILKLYVSQLFVEIFVNCEGRPLFKYILFLQFKHKALAKQFRKTLFYLVPVPFLVKIRSLFYWAQLYCLVGQRNKI